MKWNNPIEIQLRNAICDAVKNGDEFMLADYSTSNESVRIVDVDGSWELDKYELDVDPGFSDWGEGTKSISMYRNVRFKSYRIDLLIVIDYEVMLAIECDGHDWHERTKQQASADRARDREFLLNGIRVIRFTGSDIVHDSDRCAKECLDIVRVLKNELDARLERQFAAYKRGREIGQEEGAEAQEKYNDAWHANRGIFAGILSGLG